MNTTIIIILVILVIGISILGWLQKILLVSKKTKSSEYLYEKRKRLLSKSEEEFYWILKEAIFEGQVIFSKVRLEDIISVKRGIDKKLAYSLRNRIKSRHIDFVICYEKNFEIFCCVELDDKSHQRSDRKKRDEFINEALAVANIPILRVTARKNYELAEIKERLTNLVSDREPVAGTDAAR